MERESKIAVHVLTGFLGSGKTTLLNRLLAVGAYANTVVVVNELGDIGLDHLLVTEQAGEIALLEGGCLCCAIVDSLPETLLELCRKRAAGEVPPFQRIVVETTGLADPGPIVDVIRHSPVLGHFLMPGVVVTTLDMLTSGEIVARHPEALRQLVLADRIVLTKLDLRAPLTTAELDGLRAITPLAELLTQEDVEAAPGRLVAPPPLARQPAPPESSDQSHGHAHHSHGVRAWSLPVPELVTRAGLAAFAAALRHRIGPDLLRCKGLVCTARGPMLVQGVGTRFDFVAAPQLADRIEPHVTCIVQARDQAEIAALIPWLHVPEGTLPPTAQEFA